MLKALLVALLMLWPLLAQGQGGAFSPGGAANGGAVKCTIGTGIKQVYPLGTCRNSPADGDLVIFTDAASDSDCSIGGGSEVTLCQWDAGIVAAHKWEIAAGGLANVAADTSPDLGGDLTLGAFGLVTAGGVVSAANIDLLRGGLLIGDIAAFTEAALEGRITGTPNLLKATDAASLLGSAGLTTGLVWVSDGAGGWTSGNPVLASELASIGQLEGFVGNVHSPADSDLRSTAAASVLLGSATAQDVELRRNTTVAMALRATQAEMSDTYKLFKSSGVSGSTFLTIANPGFATATAIDVVMGAFSTIRHNVGIDMVSGTAGLLSFRATNAADSGTSSVLGFDFSFLPNATAGLRAVEMRPVGMPLRLRKGAGSSAPLEIGSEIVVRNASTETGELGRPSLAQYRWNPSLAYRSCDPANQKVCNSPHGMVYIDLLQAWADIPGGNYDPDLSSFGFFATVNSVLDFIAAGDTEYPVNTGAGTKAQWSTGALTSLLADGADISLCRDTGDYTPCDTNAAGCEPAVAATDQHPQLFILEDNSTNMKRYYPVAGYNYTGCQSTTNTISVKRLPVAFNPTEDKVYSWARDGAGLHPSIYYWRWAMQMLAEATFEEYYIPKRNLLANGHMESNCTGWTDRGTAALVPTQEGFKPTDARPGYGSVYGNACKFTKVSGVATRVQPGLVDVIPGRWYILRGHINASFATAGQVGLILQDGADRDALFGIPGYPWYMADTDLVQLTGDSTLAYGGNHQQRGQVKYVLKFRVPADVTSVTFEVKYSPGSGEAIVLDEWYLFEDPNQTEGFVPIFPDIGNLALLGEGDSRTHDAADALKFLLDGGAAGSYVRPFFSTWPVFRELSSRNDGHQFSDRTAVAAGGLVPEKIKADAVLSILGINNTHVLFAPNSDYEGPNETQTQMKAYSKRIRRTGAMHVQIADQRMWGDWDGGAVPGSEGLICETDGITTSGRNIATQTTNCATVQNELQRQVIQEGDAF